MVHKFIADNRVGTLGLTDLFLSLAHSSNSDNVDRSQSKNRGFGM
jgi:hypothetical protein